MATKFNGALHLMGEEITVHGSSIFTGIVKGYIENGKEYIYDPRDNVLSFKGNDGTYLFFLAPSEEPVFQDFMPCYIEFEGMWFTSFANYGYQNSCGISTLHDFI